VDAGTSGEIANVITCREIMTKGEVVVCHPDTPVAEALETLGTRKLTGMPVMDRATGALVGVVSDFDLLSLEDIAGRAEGGGDIFPATGESWLAFKAVKNLLDKQAGKTVQDVMTPNPVTVTPDTSLEEAARLLLLKNIRRLPVLGDSGELIGVVSRSNIVQAAVKLRKGML